MIVYKIDVLLEKRCMKFIWNLLNSDYKMHARIAKYSLNNCDTSIGENFIYKYKLSYKDWYSPFCNINKAINNYVAINCIQMLHTGRAVRELCKSRDNNSLQHFNRKDCVDFINLLCVK